MIKRGNRGRLEAFWFHARKHWGFDKLPFVEDDWLVKVEKKQPRANGMITEIDWARRIRNPEKKKEEYELFYENHNMAPISYDKLQKDPETGQEVLTVYNPDRGVYMPYNVDLKFREKAEEMDLEVDLDSKNWYYWAASSLETMSHYWEPDEDVSWWQTPQGIGVLMLIFGGFFFLLYGWGLQSAMEGIAKQMAESSQSMVEAAKQIASVQGG